MEDFDLEDQLQEEESYYHELMLQEEESYDQELIEQDNMDRNISHEKHSSVSVSSPSSSSGVQNALNQEGSHQSRNKSSNLNMKPPHLIERLQPISQSLFPYSGLVTQLPSYRSIDSTKCLRDRPPLGEEYESITLPNGKRKYLYFRKTEPKSLFSERESLLSKPMEEILKEAEQRKITALSSYEENTIPEARDLFFGDQSKAHVKVSFHYFYSQIDFP